MIVSGGDLIDARKEAAISAIVIVDVVGVVALFVDISEAIATDDLALTVGVAAVSIAYVSVIALLSAIVIKDEGIAADSISAVVGAAVRVG